MKRAFIIFMVAALCLTFGIRTSAESSNHIENTYIYIDATANGPEVSKIIVEFKDAISTVRADGLQLTMADVKHEVDNVYLCSNQGDSIDGASKYVAFDVGEEIVEDGASSGFSFMAGSVFARNELSHSVWADNYQVQLSAESFLVDNMPLSLAIDEDCINNRICPSTELYNYRSTFSGSYTNPMTGNEEEQTLHIAAYEPESLSGGEKNPLLIWLHGQGEGGKDPDISILGNEVSALAKERIQSHFTTNDVVGAYVLIPQCETYWMDEGDGTNGSGGGDARYTQILKDAIDAYLEHNTDVDPGRIYIGGCSNGGYMTVNMLVNYPEMFAAAYPICEGYSYYLFERNEDGTYIADKSSMAFGNFSFGDDEGFGQSSGEGFGQSSGDAVSQEDESAEKKATGFNGSVYDEAGLWMTPEKIEALKQTPAWFIVSADDSMINPATYVLPTYRALLQAGAEHCHLSVFASKGHFVWVPFFQDNVTGVQDAAAMAEGSIPSVSDASVASYPIVPTDEGGGSLAAEGYTNIFAWLNVQSR